MHIYSSRLCLFAVCLAEIGYVSDSPENFIISLRFLVGLEFLVMSIILGWTSLKILVQRGILKEIKNFSNNF